MKVAYICNCKRFCTNSTGCILNGGPCSHTVDINYAKNYTETPLLTEDKNFINLSNGYNEAYYYEEENNGYIGHEDNK